MANMSYNMFWINVKRIFKSGLLNFSRNGFVTFSSIIIMTITLLIIGTALFSGAFSRYMIDMVKEKVDVNVYFLTTAVEADILDVKQSIEKLPEVKEVTYVSKEQALANFEERHKNDAQTLLALDELSENPLGAVFNIKAKEPSQYEGIAEFLKGNSALTKSGENIIDKVTYFQNKIVIDRLGKLTNAAEMIGYWLTLIFIIISVVITFNTIKLTIFMAKDEISVMKLVGASHDYVKGPFVVSGLLCGLISSIIVLIIFMIIALSINQFSVDYFAGFSFWQYYLANILQILLIFIGSGLILGALSSYLAVRKYLKD
jgi:cell division transport system permease protein